MVIDFLRARHVGHDVVGVAGLYCNFKERDAQTPENLLAACCAQWAPQTLPDVFDNLYSTHNAAKTRPRWQEIYKVFEGCITELRTTYLIIDALDECSQESRTALLELFKILPSNVSLMVLTRHIDEIVQEFRAFPMVEIRASLGDLKKYTTSRIKSNRRLWGHVRDDASLQQTISDRVASKADGM